jgi:predicted Zn-dependent protease
MAIASMLQAGRLREAEQACGSLLARSPRLPAALHLLGLIREQSGVAPGGEELLRQSIALEPANQEFQLNLAQLLRRRGRLEEAETVLRALLAAAPTMRAARQMLAVLLADRGRHAAGELEARTLMEHGADDADAWSLLAFTLGNQSRFAEAEAAYHQALRRDARHPLALHNLGAMLSRLERAEEALVMLERAQGAGAPTFELQCNRGRALSQLRRLEEAEAAFAVAVAQNPLHIDAQVNLARLRYMIGDADFARALRASAAAHPGHIALQVSLASVLKNAGQLERAEDQLRAALQARGDVPELRGVLAQILLEAGRLHEAGLEAAAAAAARPEDSAIIDTQVLVLLSRGLPEAALPFIAVQRRREPMVQSWIAYEATAARLLGRESYRELYDFERLVQTYELEPPPGWPSIGALNAALLASLQARHRLAVQPLDQSLRHGSQTTRNLLAEPDAAIQAVLAAFDDPIREYQRRLGRAASHPLSARNTSGAQIFGAWSVQLHQAGFHVNHLHPEGWISSAYYVDVPPEVQDTEAKSGWLKFGEPRFPVPGAVPERFVQPAAGRLVLFPSYMWHGTNPIRGTQTRTSIAFDVVPRP